MVISKPPWGGGCVRRGASEVADEQPDDALQHTAGCGGDTAGQRVVSLGDAAREPDRSDGTYPGVRAAGQPSGHVQATVAMVSVASALAQSMP